MNKRILVLRLLVVCVVVVVFLSNHFYEEGSLAALSLKVSGFLMLNISAFGRVWSAAFISGKKSNTLVTYGPYSVVRNPLYFFSFVGFVGAGLAFGSVSIAAAFGVIFFLAHWPTILKEEALLGELFPDSFENYMSSVPRFIPRPWLMNAPESVSFSPRVFSKALLDSSLLMSVFIVAMVIEWAHLHSLLPVYVTLY